MVSRSQPSIESIIHELRVSGDPTEETWADEIAALKARVAELEGALRFYADPNKASGRIARAALSHAGPVARDGER